MGVCYSSVDGKTKKEWETRNGKAESKLKKSGSRDLARFISKLGSCGPAAAAAAAGFAEDRALHQIPGRRLCSNGASRIASLYTQQGKKGTNQDAMIIWENFSNGSDANATFCGVFDGHGPYGHTVARKVRDVLPIMLRSQWESEPQSDQCSVHENGDYQGMRPFDDSMDDEGCEFMESEDSEKVPEMYVPLKKSMLKVFKLMDKELKLHPTIDCFCSGSTAVTLIMKGQDLIIGNLGDSRAVLATRDKDNDLVALQLTVDLKPNLPGEAARIHKCKGRVFALQDEPEVARVWLPNSDSPGLAMARAFGDFCLKDFGLISIPEVYYHHITDRDEFVILASDGVWDVLSNKEAVDIVASAPSHGTAARAVVDCATRAWRLKYPTSKIDDCAVVCLFLDHGSVSDVPKSQNDTENAPEDKMKDGQKEEMEKVYAEDDTHSKNTDADAPKAALFVPSGIAKESSEIVPIAEEMEKPMEASLGQSKRSLAECLSTAEDEEWSALEGVTRVNSLLSLPRFLARSGRSLSRRKGL